MILSALCLAANLYFEARGESIDGQILVVEEIGDWFDLSYSMAKSLAMLAILLWPVAMIAEMMMVNKDDI
jgi:hypothetical protein